MQENFRKFLQCWKVLIKIFHKNLPGIEGMKPKVAATGTGGKIGAVWAAGFEDDVSMSGLKYLDPKNLWFKQRNPMN